jgi:hypothetical protein
MLATISLNPRDRLGAHTLTEKIGEAPRVRSE